MLQTAKIAERMWLSGSRPYPPAILLVITTVCLLPSAVRAQQQDPGNQEITAVPNRPTFSTTAEAVQSGVFEFEYGFEATRSHQNINGLLKFGVTKNLELRFGNNPIERDSGVAGVGDSNVGIKYRLLTQQAKLPTISVLYTASLPTAGSGLGAVSYGHFVSALLSKDFGEHHLDFNEGVQFTGRSGANGFDRSYFTALAYSHPITQKWGWTGELAGYSRANVQLPASMTILAAPTYNVSPRLVLDAGAYYGAFGNLPRVTLFGGVTYAIADLYHHRHREQAVKR